MFHNLPDPCPVQTHLRRDLPIAPALRTQLHNHAPLFGLIRVFLNACGIYGKAKGQYTPSVRVTSPLPTVMYSRQ